LIGRLYVRELLGFKSVALSFDPGLVVLSGPSGAGKSVLMGAILAAFGVEGSEAALCEVEMKRPASLHSDAYVLEDDLVVRILKKDRIRYYINDQNISKKALQNLLSPSLHYLSVRSSGGFESERLLELFDAALAKREKSYAKQFKEYQKRYRHYREKSAELDRIRAQETKLKELIEFTEFEIQKIHAIDPKPGEDTDLLALKKQLSRIDKISEALSNAEGIFAAEGYITALFDLTGKDGTYFSDTMNQLRADLEEMHSLADALEETDVENLLDRLEKITELKHRHGSIEEAIAYRIQKEEELASYGRREADKSTLESFLALEFADLTVIAGRISQARREQAQKLEASLGEHLSKLKLPSVSFVFEEVALGEFGTDSVGLSLSGSGAATLSGGEHNRLRLALMAVSLESSGEEKGVIVLDEIDANVSGDESIAIAGLIAKLSSAYQVFAISHQPHLAAKASMHILIDRQERGSCATVLDRVGRVQEIARIIGGETAGEEALAFAEKLLA